MRLLLVLAVAVLARAHDPATTKLTWSAEISRIVYKRCSGCHRDGAQAMPLVRYEEVRPWAKAIRDEVLSRRMPPWGAVKGFGDFQGDRSLTQDEIMRIAEWVEGGAPEGDAAHLPSLPDVEAAPRPAPAGTRVRAPVLRRATTLVAIRPFGDVVEAKITAHRSDGIIEPLLWLREYKAKWNHTFVFRQPLPLPAGTRLVAEPPVPFEVIARPRARKRR